MSNLIKGIININRVIGEDGSEYDYEVPSETVALLYAGLLRQNQPILFETGLTPKVSGLDIASNVQIDSERVPLGSIDGLIILLEATKGFGVVHDQLLNYANTRGMETIFKLGNVNGELIGQNQKVRYSLKNNGSFLEAVDVTPVNGAHVGILHKYDSSFESIIVQETGSLVKIRLPQFKVVNSIHDFLEGQRLRFDVQEENGNPSAYNITIDKSFSPTFYGVIISDGQSQKYILNVVNKRKYEINNNLDDGTFVSFKMNTYDSKKRKPIDVQTIDKLPFGKYEGEIRTVDTGYNPDGVLYNETLGEVNFSRQDILHLGKNYWEKVHAIDVGNPVKFEVVGSGNNSFATRILLQ